MIYEAYVAAGAPTLDDMASAVAEDDELRACPSRDTINRLVGDASTVGKQADAVALVTVLTRMAGGDARQAARTAATSWTQAQLSEPLGRPLADIDPYDLEVHRSITVRGASGLPTYVERAHDIELRRLVADAVQGASRLVLLVGTSSTGKTRACFEALRHLPRDWRLWHPIDPERPRAALDALDQVGPKTVVWLNEAHHYLLHREHGEPIAAGLRTLLADSTRAPVLVLGTIWPGPGYFDDVRSTPSPGEPDPHAQARVLLAGRVIHVPAAFSPSEVDELKRSPDPRLAAAASSAQDGMIAQYLAAAFELIDIYTAAPPGTKALLNAAIDARRLGHPVSLPLPFLVAAAEGYLTDSEWELLPDNWLEQAIDQLTNPIKGARGPLHPQRRPRGSMEPGNPATRQTYRLADFLEDHGRAERRLERVPPLFWQAALRHCEDESAHRLALAAAARGFAEVACRLWGKVGAYEQVARTLTEMDRLDEALPWYERAAAEGNALAFRLAGRHLAEAGRADDALSWYERAAAAGDAEALLWAGDQLAETGRVDEAYDD
ncbi:hypothetical protein [Streptomyces sp. SD15]